MTNLNYFWIRRIHSLLGVIPLGVFLFGHLTTNSMAFFGQEAFDHKVELIHSLGPLLPIVEATVIFVPLALHILIGIFIARTAKLDVGDLGYGRYWAYKFQRWTGWAALAFIVWHTLTLRFLSVAKPYALTPEATGFFEYLSVMFTNYPLFTVAYVIGGTSVIYHFANGLCTFCMTWGITVGPKSQQGLAYVALAAGVVLMGMLLSSVAGFYQAYEPHFELDSPQRRAIQAESAAGEISVGMIPATTGSEGSF
jgi:succinate dehydrogenase / fumarate reductase cytochrome b subunit